MLNYNTPNGLLAAKAKGGVRLIFSWNLGSVPECSTYVVYWYNIKFYTLLGNTFTRISALFNNHELHLYRVRHRLKKVEICYHELVIYAGLGRY